MSKGSGSAAPAIYFGHPSHQRAQIRGRKIFIPSQTAGFPSITNEFRKRTQVFRRAPFRFSLEIQLMVSAFACGTLPPTQVLLRLPRSKNAFSII
jgi:hypothetical protein